MELRPYQEQAVSDVLDLLPQHTVLVSPVGSGKTVMGTEIVKRYGKRTLWIAHRTELLDQAIERLNKAGLTTNRIQAGNSGGDNQVQVASISTLSRRDIPSADLVVIDECHHAPAESYRSVCESLMVPRLGLTATPFRMDMRSLRDVFDKMVEATNVRQLIDGGWLRKPKVFCRVVPDFRALRTIAGEFDIERAAEIYREHDEWCADMIGEWIGKASGLRTVAFACTVSHSEQIVSAFKTAGVSAEHLDGGTSKDNRRAILDRLKSGETSIVSNVGILTEGYDLPELECAIIARPTKSLCIHMQACGRIVRPFEGKCDPIILDFAGNHQMHGKIDRHMVFSLDTVWGVNLGDSASKECPECTFQIDDWMEVCPECGYRFASGGGSAIEDDGESDREEDIDRSRNILPIHGDGELVELDESWDARFKMFGSWKVEGEAKGYKPGYAAKMYKKWYGKYPIVVDGDIVNPEEASDTVRKEVYMQWLDLAKEKGWSGGWAAHRYKEQWGNFPPWSWKDEWRDRETLKERWRMRSEARTAWACR